MLQPLNLAHDKVIVFQKQTKDWILYPNKKWTTIFPIFKQSSTIIRVTEKITIVKCINV